MASGGTYADSFRCSSTCLTAGGASGRPPPGAAPHRAHLLRDSLLQQPSPAPPRYSATRPPLLSSLPAARVLLHRGSCHRGHPQCREARARREDAMEAHEVAPGRGGPPGRLSAPRGAGGWARRLPLRRAGARDTRGAEQAGTLHVKRSVRGGVIRERHELDEPPRHGRPAVASRRLPDGGRPDRAPPGLREHTHEGTREDGIQ